MQKLVSDFMYGFYGYGNVNAPHWFIGMEEGCGSEDLMERFESWDTRGRKLFEDVREYHRSFGVRELWEAEGHSNVKVQPTWRRLIETLLSAQGKDVALENVRQAQVETFGMSDGDTCLLELLPLPSPNLKEFCYKTLANEDYPFFASRRLYRNEVKNARIASIRNLILTHKPRHVVLYGTTYQKDWSNLVNHAEWTQTAPRIKRSQLGDSYIWMVPHPVAFGLPSKLFVNLGAQMRELT